MCTELRQRTIDTLIVGNYSERTIDSYLNWLIRISRYYKQSPAELSSEQVQAFLLYLIKDQKLAWSTVNQALSAFRFLFEKVLLLPRAKLRVPARRKVTHRAFAYSREQVKLLLHHAQNPKHRALLMTVYGAGLRVSEVVRLRPEHIESQRKLIRIDQGKGQKDRYTLLPEKVLHELRDYYRCFHPGEWLFFGRDRAQPLSIGTAQKTFYLVRGRAGIEKGGIHTLRHSFASHMLENGADIFELKRLMGHSSIKTTCGYIHLSQEHLLRVQSPLDSL